MLADVPTDQLVLKLLQELAARVEKLERRGETMEQKNPSLKEYQAISSPESPIANTTQPSATSSASEGSEAENEDSYCSVCGGLLGSSCDYIEIPYGYLLGGEAPSKDARLVSIKAKANAL
jgi:hypothetical protein